MALHAIDQLVETYGVEPLRDPADGDFDHDGAPAYEYLNTGDTYAATLLYSRDDDTLSIGSWGDVAESFESGDENCQRG